jgi:hypothetical protein
MFRRLRSWWDPPPPLTLDASKDQVGAYLRHPTHHVRCFCGRYGLIWPETGRVEYDLQVRDDDGAHEYHRCQPWDEVIA